MIKHKFYFDIFFNINVLALVILPGLFRHVKLDYVLD